MSVSVQSSVQRINHLVQLVAGADKDECGEKDVDDWIVGDEHQHAVGVRTVTVTSTVQLSPGWAAT